MSPGDGLHRAHSARAVEDPDAHLMPGRDPQDVQQVSGSGAGEADITCAADFAGLEQDQIHAT